MQTSTVSDKELITNYIIGDSKSLDILIERHYQKVFSYILMTVKDKELAEDLLQETFVKVINTIKGGNYADQGKFIHWVMRIAHNLVIDYFRKSGRVSMIKNNPEEGDIFDRIRITDESIEEQLIKDQIYSDIRNLIELLPPEQKEVVYLRHFANKSFKEIADLTGVSINTALGRMRYALIKIRKMCEENNIVLSY